MEIHTLLVGVERLLEEIIASENHDDGKVLVDQGEDTVLQFARHDGLTMQVGDLLDLESTLEGSGELTATSKEE